MIDWRKTLLSQYGGSPVIQALIRSFNDRVDPAAAIESFYRRVFDPRTAVGWGLDVWGRIVDISRIIAIQTQDDVFGFDGSGANPFEQAPFASGTDAVKTHTLTDQAYRTLIFFKAGINIADGSMQSLNRIVHAMFADRGAAMALHVGPMKIRFFFDFYLKPHEAALIRQENVPPKPVGVGFDVYQVRRSQTFGFAGSGLQPFKQGNFVKGAPQSVYSALSP